MVISQKPLSRRTVLKGMGATIALPLLDAMVPARGFAQSAAGPKMRFAAIEMVHGSAGCDQVRGGEEHVVAGRRSGARSTSRRAA